MMNWLLTKILTALLLRIGIKASLASSLVPLILRTIKEAKAAIDAAKAEGGSDMDALDDAAKIILPPNHPDRKRVWPDDAHDNTNG